MRSPATAARLTAMQSAHASEDQLRTAAVEFDGGLQRDELGQVALVLRRRLLLCCSIEVGNVGGVVLGVVQLHDLTADDRLQRGVVVGQVRQLLRTQRLATSTK